MAGASNGELAMISARAPASAAGGEIETVSRVLARRQGDGEREDRSARGTVLEPQRAAHEPHELPGNGQPEAGALETPGVRAVALLEGREDRLAPLGRDAGAGVGDGEAEPVVRDVRSTETQTPPCSVNLIALPARFKSTCLRRIASARTNRGAAALTEAAISRPLLCARGARSSTTPSTSRCRSTGATDKIQPAGFHSGKIEDLIDQRDEGRAGAADRLDITRVLGAEPRPSQQVRHAENAVQGRADLMAHGREEARFGDARRLGAVALGGRLLEPPDFVAERLVLGGGSARPLLGAAASAPQAPRRARPASRGPRPPGC